MQEAPRVTVSGGAAPAARPVARPGRSVALPLGLAALAVVGLLLVTREVPHGPEAALTVAGDRLTVTRGGVLVVPLELRNAGEALEVVDAAVHAAPVVEDPLVQAPEVLAAGAGRRFVALLAPDCRVLRRDRPPPFAAEVLLRVRASGRTAALVADLDADPAVASQVRALCR